MSEPTTPRDEYTNSEWIDERDRIMQGWYKTRITSNPAYLEGIRGLCENSPVCLWLEDGMLLDCGRFALHVGGEDYPFEISTFKEKVGTRWSFHEESEYTAHNQDELYGFLDGYKYITDHLYRKFPLDQPVFRMSAEHCYEHLQQWFDKKFEKHPNFARLYTRCGPQAEKGYRYQTPRGLLECYHASEHDFVLVLDCTDARDRTPVLRAQREDNMTVRSMIELLDEWYDARA